MDDIYQQAHEADIGEADFVLDENGHVHSAVTIGTTYSYVVVDSTLRPLEKALRIYPTLLTNPRLIDGTVCGVLPIVGNERRIVALVPVINGGYTAESQAMDAALAPFLNGSDRFDSKVEGYFVTDDATGRIVSGQVSAVVNSNTMAHSGWLFFGRTIQATQNSAPRGRSTTSPLPDTYDAIKSGPASGSSWRTSINEFLPGDYASDAAAAPDRVNRETPTSEQPDM